jgi:hypothetical protein
VVVFFSVTTSGNGGVYELVDVVVVCRCAVPEEHAARHGNIRAMMSTVLVIDILLFRCTSHT